ncbi:MAG: hypothetical protein LBE61_00320 [Burkholderiaceae bacterium]|jgi:hypothetical protein|nr:hypothetical protein [Burkholderiaceae bacterium]
MTPQQKLKHAILLKAVVHKTIADPGQITAGNVDEVYDDLNVDGNLQDAREKIRCSGTETGLTCNWSRHYESDAVAAQMPDGSWVGWTYWYGGGKHGEPEAIEWIAHAYDLACEEKQVTVTQRTFTKI